MGRAGALIALNIALAVTCACAQGSRWPKIEKLPDAPPACPQWLRSSIIWGGATSAYQIEGAWNEDGKGPSIWDTFAQKGGETQGNANGNVANDHYHRWREDIELMKTLGVKTYRFSVAWARIVPSGTAGSAVNQKGIDWYKNLITELLKAGIVPAVTMYHWDMPQGLQDSAGGFLSEGPAFVDAFAYYADVLFRELGPLVKLWMTFNEPLSICNLGYNEGIFAPGIKNGPWGQYKCGHNLLLAHARAYRLYKERYAGQQGGKIAMALDGKWGYPYDPNSQADRDAAQAWMEWQYGYYSGYLDEACKAVTQDGVRLTTYWAWSLWDNFEWREAYTQRFGLVYVDIENNLERTPKASAWWFARHFYSTSARHDESHYKGYWKP
ncbi:glycoside hydrolase family 1 [Raphidocelis subcapitata]|uniref:Glycoside hydrolase family 1 n=1 Tax=Raphidocelis subcapitata TaxID=307507 RepID=A0A2V0PGQ7_9CHLO|nr:glycoside hydrolase family 1 [Raphidocelis subcapitata]|eukprot:GBF98739.1 glycoside hydrolase family 1 [Raphidocelis subcapitata]